MKIFLDTADTDVIRKHFETGLIDGVTTNPTLIRKSGRDPLEVYQEISDIGVRDISMEVSGTAEEMFSDGVSLKKRFGDVATIKVPCTREGLATCKQLSREVIKTNNGAQIVTMPPAIFDKMYDHILTDAGMEIFERDLREAQVERQS